jgi:uncharacterized protein with PIN domain
MNEEVLECQDCGTPVKQLSVEEARLVADKPYNFVVYCKYCQKDRLLSGNQNE